MHQQINIGWLTRNADPLLENQLPSLRLRLSAAKTSTNLNIKSGTNLNIDSSDIFVISKYSYISPGDDLILGKVLDFSNQIKAQKKILLVDYTDHYLYDLESHRNQNIDPVIFNQYDRTSKFYKELIAKSDGIIVSSPGLYKEVSSYTQKPVYFLADAIDPVPSNFKNPTSTEVSGLWYGMHSTFKLFLSSLPKLSSSLDTTTRIHCLVQDFTFKKLKAKQIEIPKTKNIVLEAEVWSFERMLKRAEKAHFIVIPSNVTDFRKSLASSNRLLTAFSLRRPVWATPIDSYREFDEHFYNLDRPSFNINSELTNHTIAQTDLAFKVSMNYSMSSMGEYWSKLFFNILMKTNPLD